jgi:hypothetical protein
MAAALANEKPSGSPQPPSHDSDSASHHSQHPTLTGVPAPQPFTGAFFGKDNDVSKARAEYIKTHLKGLTLVSLTIFVVLSIFWGALWSVGSHVHNLKGWVVVSRFPIFCLLTVNNPFCTIIGF